MAVLFFIARRVRVLVHVRVRMRMAVRRPIGVGVLVGMGVLVTVRVHRDLLGAKCVEYLSQGAGSVVESPVGTGSPMPAMPVSREGLM